MPSQDALFLVQSKVIRDISERSSCVIVGRSADFILKSHPHCFNVFVHADKAFRLERIINNYGFDPADAEAQMMQKTANGLISVNIMHTRPCGAS